MAASDGLAAMRFETFFQSLKPESDSRQMSSAPAAVAPWCSRPAAAQSEIVWELTPATLAASKAVIISTSVAHDGHQSVRLWGRDV
jgi:hypothetical protein